MRLVTESLNTNKTMAKKKTYKVMCYCTYKSGNTEYCVGTFTTKKGAREYLNRQYTTISRTFTIVEE